MPGESYPGYFLDDGNPEHWKFQWGRVGRWFERVSQVKSKSETTELDACDYDVLIAFFQNCYILREWILKFRPDLQRSLDYFFKPRFEMKACRDICNGFKHVKLVNPSLDKDFKIVRTYDYLEIMSSIECKNPIKYHFAFEYGNYIQKYDIFDLAG